MLIFIIIDTLLPINFLFVRMLALQVLARTTPLVKAVLLTRVIDACVLLDLRVRLVTKVHIKI